MKGLKKFLGAVLVYIFSSLFCCMEVSALFINAHFNLGKIIIEQSGISLSEDEKNAFLSGLVYADIGRFKFDKETNIDSDSYRFVEEMKKHAMTSEEKWFIHGCEMHILQDKETNKFLREILGRDSSSYLEYIMNCSLLDSYFFRKTGCYIFNDFLHKFNFKQVSYGLDMKKISHAVGIPEDKIEDFINIALNRYSAKSDKYQLIIYADLIKDTYHSFGFEIGLDDIYEQAANILGASIISAAVAEKNEISPDLAYNIEVQSDKLAKLCVSKL